MQFVFSFDLNGLRKGGLKDMDWLWTSAHFYLYILYYTTKRPICEAIEIGVELICW